MDTELYAIPTSSAVNVRLGIISPTASQSFDTPRFQIVEGGDHLSLPQHKIRVYGIILTQNFL